MKSSLSPLVLKAAAPLHCDREALKQPIPMTSAYHLPRSVEAFRRAGLETVPYPTNFYVPRSGGYTLLSYLPTPESLPKSAREGGRYSRIVNREPGWACGRESSFIGIRRCDRIVRWQMPERSPGEALRKMFRRTGVKVRQPPL